MPFNGRTYPYEAPNNRGHVWETDEDGDLNIFAHTSGDRHNGPRCVRCGYEFCHHCEEGAQEDCSAVGKTGDQHG